MGKREFDFTIWKSAILHFLWSGYRHGPESHFNVLIVSDSFDGAKPVKRQRMINSILKEEMKSMHALSCSIRTNSEYDDHDAPHKTPNCAGKS